MLSRKTVLCVILLSASILVTTAMGQTAQPKGSPAPEKITAIHAANLIDGVAN